LPALLLAVSTGKEKEQFRRNAPRMPKKNYKRHPCSPIYPIFQQLKPHLKFLQIALKLARAVLEP